jgi:hypothetical protein
LSFSKLKKLNLQVKVTKSCKKLKKPLYFVYSFTRPKKAIIVIVTRGEEENTPPP